MSKIALYLGVVVALAACGERHSPERGQTINPAIGDVSWTLARPPANEGERIATHLRYVADRLAAVEVAPELRARRAEVLDVLRAYADRGVFPALDAPLGHRTPRFVDRDGNLCAVGFLVATTAGEALARELGAAYEYAYIDDIADPRLDAWAREQGFTRDELAMIQPEYSFEQRCNGWGVGDGDACPSQRLRGRRLLYSVGIGGGMSRADGRDLTYFTWGADVRFSILPWLAIGLADLTARLGPEPAGGNHVALTATPLLELSRWGGMRNPTSARQWHLDLGLTTQHVIADRGPQHPYAAELALGLRALAADVVEPDLIIGVQVALADGFVIDDRISAGSVVPFIRLAVGFRPGSGPPKPLIGQR